nr:serine/threonine protein kinase [Anaerolineae bacterium]
MEQLIGKTLGNYEIVELIGKGGMAAVYKGFQSSMNRHVAVKIMAQQYSSDPAFVGRFKNEAQVIAQIEHAHILPVYDFGEHDGMLYIVMRYLPTGTLEDRIVEGGMPGKDAVAIFKQIASALDFAHSRGIIHRDLKPANILIDGQGNAFLSDFGIAKSLEGGQNLTGTGSVVGTPTYMSPEQGLGEDIDSRTDIYALGVMLFEMLTGRVPFTADNPMAVMLKHINEAPPSVRSFNPNIHPEVEAVVLQAMAKERADRFQKAEEMIEALEYAVSAATGAAVATRPDSFHSIEAVSSAAGPIPTLSAPVSGIPQSATAVPFPGAPGMPAPLSPLAQLDEIKIDLNSISTWIASKEWLGTWVQALGLSLATFVMLLRLTENATLEVGLLSLVPGILLYGLLRAPMVGALTSMLLILAPLLAHAPGLAVIWLVATIVVGARLSSREIMLMLVTAAVAGNPLGWLVPLLAPWWLRARRVVTPVALGTIFAVLFAITLGWPDAGGLLPAPTLSPDVKEKLFFTDFNTTYLGLFEDSSTWLGYTDMQGLLATLLHTNTTIGNIIVDTLGLPLIIAAAWALAAVLSVSNRRVDHPALRAMGLGLGFSLLLSVHLLYRPEAAGLDNIRFFPILLAVLTLPISFLLSQWPIQADPAAGSKSGTNLNLLRRTAGAFFMSLGVSFFAAYLIDSPTFPAIVWGGIIGTLATIANPLIGPPLVFASLIAALAPVRLTQTIIVAIILFLYVVVSFFFDKRRPRAWNPLGAGVIIGSPGMAGLGILPLGALSLGALEAQVPSALLIIATHIILVAVLGNQVNPLAFITQVITALAGILVIERLMSIKLLDTLNQKLRRLIFTVGMALIMAISYYTVGNVAEGMFFRALLLSIITSGALVAAMGNRAMFWRQFIERKEDEEPEDYTLDEDITGPWARQRPQG